MYNDGESFFDNSYLFQGRRLDAKTNLYHFRNRQYSPTHGRFLQRDPKGYEDSPNLYQAFGGRPLLSLDPYGLEPITYEDTQRAKTDTIGQARAVRASAEAKYGRQAEFANRAAKRVAEDCEMDDKEAEALLERVNKTLSNPPWRQGGSVTGTADVLAIVGQTLEMTGKSARGAGAFARGLGTTANVLTGAGGLYSGYQLGDGIAKGDSADIIQGSTGLIGAALVLTLPARASNPIGWAITIGQVGSTVIQEGANYFYVDPLMEEIRASSCELNKKDLAKRLDKMSEIRKSLK